MTSKRQAGAPWDVITIEVTDSALADNQQLMETLIQHYGRTCRRIALRWFTRSPAPCTPAVSA
ncbi:hypothetical protein PI861_00010 [Aeromonas salmonicida subsp. salmonicida]|uniref:hypothetical protein n=1 Tax=Aeromonas salmonicida TaxID=645 RepID=UPI00192F6B53|nr:hypothetical protein [Aeromonas salmonicida]WCB54610.1 hypothetical protein PI861_00010 [Aeromonas salmonicida subsp. salmonicida]